MANLDSDDVTPVDLGTWRAGPPIPVGTEPVAIAVSTAASGAATAFVADFGSNAVTPIDVSTMTAGAAIAVGPGPQTIAVASSEVLVGNFGNRTLTPINAATLRTGPAPWRCPSTRPAWRCCPRARPSTCAAARASCRSPTLGLAVGHPVGLPDVAQGIALTADGTTAWVTQQTGSVVPVTLATGTVGPPIRLGGHPSAIVIGAG